MGGAVRLFEKTPEGLLHEVPPAEAEARRASGTVSHVALAIDVLWTDAEIAERQAMEEEARRADEAAAVEREADRLRKIAALAKLEALGITAEDLKDALG